MNLCLLIVALAGMHLHSADDLAYLQRVAHEVVDSSKVVIAGEIAGGGRNTTGYSLRVPGGTQSYYPAFWVRDASMMLGADLVSSDEIEGWVRVVAATQPGKAGLTFPHGLVIPPYSIPDHITLGGEACWFPGAYADQGVGNYGYLPPADDAFYFVQMVWDHARLTGFPSLMRTSLKTAWGDHPVSEIVANAFASVAADPETGLVTCSDVAGKGRVDWGFCDSITKSGSCLMPSLLRWQAASRLSQMFDQLGDKDKARQYHATANFISANLAPTFYQSISKGEGRLISATGLGKKDDIWASAFGVTLGVLPKHIEANVARHLAKLMQSGEIVAEGQIRHLPKTGTFGGYWEKAGSGRDTYQNGGYWATPTGWLVVALRKVNERASDKLLTDYIGFVRDNRAKGAPYEWVNPFTKATANGNYGSSAGLVYSALKEHGYYP